MTTDEILRGLRYEQKKRENDFIGTCQTDISTMCKDSADCIESLQAQLKEEVSRRYQAECNYDHAVAEAEDDAEQELPECKMAGGENEIGDSVYCHRDGSYIMKEDCRGNCENYLPTMPDDFKA